MSERVVFLDEKTLKPGCVLIQAALGGDRTLLDRHYDSTDWEVGSVGRMRPCPESLLSLAAERRRELIASPPQPKEAE